MQRCMDQETREQSSEAYPGVHTAVQVCAWCTDAHARGALVLFILCSLVHLQPDGEVRGCEQEEAGYGALEVP